MEHDVAQGARPAQAGAKSAVVAKKVGAPKEVSLPIPLEAYSRNETGGHYDSWVYSAFHGEDHVDFGKGVQKLFIIKQDDFQYDPSVQRIDDKYHRSLTCISNYSSGARNRELRVSHGPVSLPFLGLILAPAPLPLLGLALVPVPLSFLGLVLAPAPLLFLGLALIPVPLPFLGLVLAPAPLLFLGLVLAPVPVSILGILLLYLFHFSSWHLYFVNS